MHDTIGELTPREIEDVLQGQVLGRIGCHANGRTYVVPVCYAYDGNRILAHSSVGLKIHMMRENPNVCFEVEDVQDLKNWRSVVAWGRFEELDGLEAALAIGLLVDQLLPHVSGATIGPIQSVTPHGKPELGPDTVVYCIRLKQKTGRFERA